MVSPATSVKKFIDVYPEYDKITKELTKMTKYEKQLRKTGFIPRSDPMLKKPAT